MRIRLVAMLTAVLAIATAAIGLAQARSEHSVVSDVYMHNPRGANSRLSQS
jgi:hypothetical protein